MRHKLTRSTTIAACMIAVGLIPLNAQESTPEEMSRPAHFKVTETVVNPEVRPFTATIYTIGNTLFKSISGFEPLNWRSQWMVSETATGRAVIGSGLAHFDTLGETLLEGGFVRVYRVVNGEIKLVADSTIPEGGFVLRGWHAPNLSKTTPAGTEEYLLKWANYQDADRPYWFAVATVDSDGDVSRPSEAVRVVPPANFSEAPAVKNKFIHVRGRSDGQKPQAPANVEIEVKENGLARLSWDAVAGENVAGYLVMKSYFDPAEHEGFFIRLSDSDVEILEGDMVIAGRTLSGFTTDMISPRIHGASQQWKELFNNRFRGWGPQDTQKEGVSWTLAKHAADTPVAEPGETYLQIDLEPGSQGFSLGEHTHSGTEQEWYEVLHPGDYRVEFWMRYQGDAAPSVPFIMDGYGLEPLRFQPTNQWQFFSGTVTIPKVMEGDTPYRTELVMSEPGRYAIDNFRVYRADTEFLDYTETEYQRLRDSGMAALRTHGPIKTGRATYSMKQFLNPGGVLTGIGKSNTLPQMLAIFEKGGVDPWLQIEYHMSPEEWLAFVEFMAAPFDPVTDSADDLPYAAQRHAQGRSAPWTEAFGTIYLELSNETWNGLFHPWNFADMRDAVTGEAFNSGQVYGMFQEHVIEILRSSPHWSPEIGERFEFVIGGRHNTDYGLAAAEHSPNSAFITNAGYNGGWDEGEGASELNLLSFFNVLAHVNQSTVPRSRYYSGAIAALNTAQEEDSEAYPGVYEAGPGYQIRGLGAKLTDREVLEQELVMKSVAAGTATLDSFLARASFGYRLDNFFTFSEGPTWSSHAEWYKGQGQAYPQWMSLALFNNHGTGDILEVETLSVPTADLPQWRRREAVDDAPLAAAYASRKDQRLTVFLINRQIPNYPLKGDDGVVPFIVELPITGVESARLFSFSGDYDDQNFTDANVELREREIPAKDFTGKIRTELPPGQLEVYVFEGIK